MDSTAVLKSNDYKVDKGIKSINNIDSTMWNVYKY